MARLTSLAATAGLLLVSCGPAVIVGVAAGGGGGGGGGEAPLTLGISKPGAGSQDFDPAGVVELSFNAAIDAGTVASAVRLLLEGSTEVAASVTVRGSVIEIRPAQRLRLATRYVARVDAGVKSAAGLQLAQAVAVPFQVRDGRWGPPGNVETSDLLAGLSDTVAHADGSTTAVWLEGTSLDANGKWRLVLSQRKPGGSWGQPAEIIRDRVGIPFFDVAANTRNRTALAYIDPIATNIAARAMIFDSEGKVVVADHQLSKAGHQGVPKISISRSDKAVAAWIGPDNKTVYAAAFNSQWLDEVLLQATTASDYRNVAVTTDDVGDAIVVWDVDKKGLEYSRYLWSFNTWSKPAPLFQGSAADTLDLFPHLVARSAGSSQAFWRHSGKIHTAEYVWGGSTGWQGLAELPGTEGNAGLHKAGFSGDGHALLAFVRLDNGEESVVAKPFDPATGWGDSVPIGALQKDPIRMLSVALGPGGHGMAVWSGAWSPTSIPTVEACRYLRGSGFGPQVRIHPSGYGAGFTFDDRGTGTLLFTQVSDRPTSDVMSRSFE